MISIRSPLGALGALMVLINAIAAGALVPLKDDPTLKWIVIIALVIVMLVVVTVVCVIIYYILFKLKKPGLLFDPKDIDPSVHQELYGEQDRPRPPSADELAGLFTYTVVSDD